MIYSGRQFSIEEYDKLENGEIATDYEGNKYDGADKRHIGEYNCYHKIFSIVLGVSKPEYTDKQLNDIRESNLSGFEFEGKHFTMYERNAVTKANRVKYKKTKRHTNTCKGKWGQRVSRTKPK